MTKKIRIEGLPLFDASEHLRDEDDMTAYLTAIMEDNDPALLAAALGDIARARGMNEISKKAWITRKALYRALQPGTKPRYETLAKVCAALGVKFVLQPIHA